MQPQDTPFNARNRVMGAPDLARVLAEFAGADAAEGVADDDLDTYRRAFVHRSYCLRKNESYAAGNAARPQGCVPLQGDSNERLEFLGDAVIGLVVGDYLFQRYPSQSEGFLTQLRTKLVNGKRLAELASAVGLSTWLIISRQVEDGGGRDNEKILEDCFEAFVGAVFDRAGFDVAARWLVGVLETFVDFAELVAETHSHKDALVKLVHHAYSCAPRFVDVPSLVPGEHVVCVRDPRNDAAVLAVGRGPNRKMAENDAARRALEALA